MKKKKLIFKQMKRNLTFLGGDYMNDLQIQQYKEKVAKSLLIVKYFFYNIIKRQNFQDYMLIVLFSKQKRP